MQSDARRSSFLQKVGELICKLATYAPVDDGTDQMAKGYIHDSLPPKLTPGIDKLIIIIIIKRIWMVGVWLSEHCDSTMCKSLLSNVVFSWRQSEHTDRNVELSTTSSFHVKEVFTLCHRTSLFVINYTIGSLIIQYSQLGSWIVNDATSLCPSCRHARGPLAASHIDLRTRVFNFPAERKTKEPRDNFTAVEWVLNWSQHFE